VIRRAVVKTGLSEKDISRFMSAVPISLTPIPASVELIYELKEIGHSIYALSNMHPASIEHLEKSCPFWHLFEARIISCRVKMIKPQPEIFQYLLQTFRLQATETIFIDDTIVNLQVAEKFGITTVHFLNADHCRKELEKLGCFNKAG
jgi:putative hydrolase of the HAD superfamily